MSRRRHDRRAAPAQEARSGEPRAAPGQRDPDLQGAAVPPSTYYAVKARQPGAKALRDADRKVDNPSVYDDNLQVYGARKVWRQLRREDVVVARCTAAQLMREMGIAGVVRGTPNRTTTGEETDGPHRPRVASCRWPSGRRSPSSALSRSACVRSPCG